MPWRLLNRYIFAVCLPYTLISLSILTVILFIQQLNKLSEVLVASNAPFILAAEVLLNLSPNVLVFTLPMSVMVGVATGYSKLGHDSESIAMRAAGVGTLRAVSPALTLGVLAGALTLYIGFGVAPSAAQNIRDVVLRAALHSLESPVAPRSFYTGMPGKVIYIREGNEESGQWEGVFMHWREPDGQVRLITAARGRLDFSGDQTELVLEDAMVTTLTSGRIEAEAPEANVLVERSGHLRVRDEQLNVNRGALIKRVREREPELDEMGWSQLLATAATDANNSKRREAGIAFHRRLTLCLSPIVFSVFGALLGLRIGRGGRSHGVILSLAAMLLYYLAAVAGEQLARAGVVLPAAGGWLAFSLASVGASLLYASSGRGLGPIWGKRGVAALSSRRGDTVVIRGRRRLKLLGLLDRSIIGSLSKNFLLAFLFLILIFLIFTLFELLRFVVSSAAGAPLLARYFLFLLPFVAVTVAPVSTLLAVLITFALLVRRSEAVAWWSSGQSIFRLIVPCLFFAAAVGGGLWLVQERIMPAANRRQNSLRAEIRGGLARRETISGRTWVTGANSKNIYSFESDEAGVFRDLTVFEFKPDGMHLERIVYAAGSSIHISPTALSVKGASVMELGDGRVTLWTPPSLEYQVKDSGIAKDEVSRPSEVDAATLSAYIKALKARDMDTNSLSTSLERKRAEPFAPLVMILVGVPLALASGRRGAVAALCFAVLSGLTFWGVSAGMQQMGASGYLPPPVAAWTPLLIFAALGMYLLSRTRT